MRKFTFAFALICTVAAASFLGACNKNSDKCCGDSATCKDKAAAVKTDAAATPAADGKSCSGKCTGEKKTCPATGQSN
jgi:hypothetical protein